jgi:hypothetical protein
MSATILRLSVRPAPRAIETQPASHFQRELGAVAVNLNDAAGRFGMLSDRASDEASIVEGTRSLEAALFHALTLSGCLQADRPLRELLLSRLAQREA